MNFGSLVTPAQCPDYFHSTATSTCSQDYNTNHPNFWTQSPSNFDNLSPSSSCNSYNYSVFQHEEQERPTPNQMTFPLPKARVVKRRVSANKKERRRTLSINSAFMELRDCIPHVPVDTKLSKIKTLRLATTYISYLMDALNTDNPTQLPEDGFQSILTKALETREDRRKNAFAMASVNEKKREHGKNRTGWPQHVWATELKRPLPHHSKSDVKKFRSCN